MLIETQLPNFLHRGKVRDTYRLDDDLLLMVTTDRISAFDVVLPTGIPDKGRVLNKISAFWFAQTAHLIPNHLVTLADAPDVALKLGNSGLLADLPLAVARQSMIVKRAERIDIECVIRGYITGSAWEEYRRQGTVSEKPMPPRTGGRPAFPRAFVHPYHQGRGGPRSEHVGPRSGCYGRHRHGPAAGRGQ